MGMGQGIGTAIWVLPLITSCAERPISERATSAPSAAALVKPVSAAHRVILPVPDEPLNGAVLDPPPPTVDAPLPRSSSAFMKTIEVFLKEKKSDISGAQQIGVLLPKGISIDSVPVREPLCMALTLDVDQGTGAGMWSLYAVQKSIVKSLGEVESSNKGSVRFFRTRKGTTIFRRFWFQMVDPTPEQTHKGTFDDLELSALYLRKLSTKSTIDLHSKHGQALWNMGKGNEYSCNIETFQNTGACPLEKISDD
jgi:hypothetical protein